MPVISHKIRTTHPIETEQASAPAFPVGLTRLRGLGELTAAYLRTVLPIPLHRRRVEGLDHILAVIAAQQLVAALHQGFVALAPQGVVVELVLHDQRYAAVDHAQNIREQRDMLVVAVRRGLRGGRLPTGEINPLCGGVTGGRWGWEQRDPRQFVIGEVFDSARVASHTQQVAVMHDHDLAVTGQLQIKLDAVPSLTRRRERSQGILGRDRPFDHWRAVPRLHSHATRQRHVFAAFRSVLLGQAGTGIMQTAMRVPYLRHDGYEIVAFVIERTRRDGPCRSPGRGGGTD